MEELDSIVNNVSVLTEELDQYLRPNESLQTSWISAIKSFYDFTKIKEGKLRLPTSKEALSRLFTEDLDAEEVWQQIELQNSSLINFSESSTLSKESNLCCLIATLSNVASEAIEKSNCPSEKSLSDEDEPPVSDQESIDDLKFEDEKSLDEGVETGEEVDDADADDEPIDFSDLDADTFGDIALEGCESDESEEDGNELKDIDRMYKHKQVQIPEQNIVQNPKKNVDKESEGSGSTDETDDINYFPEKSKKGFPKNKSKLDLIKKFERTSIDSQFLSVRESEWIADNDVLGENFDLDTGDEEEEIDMMKDVDDNEATTAMYNSFFDVPNQNQTIDESHSTIIKPSLEPGTMTFDDFPEDNDYDHSKPKSSKIPPSTMSFDDDKPVSSQFGTKSFENKNPVSSQIGTMSFGEDGTIFSKNLGTGTANFGGVNEDLIPHQPISMALIGDKTVETKSTFEKEREEEMAEIEDLENENLSEKPWHLKGEVLSENRPENSTLEEHLEFNVHVRPKPIITEDVTTLMEKMILSRIRSKDFDDVERRVKPNLDPAEFKKKLILDQEKSKESLSKLYEQDYLKTRDSEKKSTDDILSRGDGVEQELPEHKQIKKSLKFIFTTLNAMSNYHFTPYAKDTEIKIVTNLPAVMLEESTPASASDATLLAPQEIVAPKRKELKGDTELTKTDKLSNRRSKKLRQKYIGKLKEDKLKAGMKKKGKHGVMDKDTSIKVVEKAIKQGKIKMLDTNSAVGKSSNTFFDQLTDNVLNKNKKRKANDDGKFKSTNKGKKKVKSAEGMKVKDVLL